MKPVPVGGSQTGSHLQTTGRWRIALACAAYAALMLYASTVVGPAGVNFVYQDPFLALRKFLSTRYIINGSDQRADWMGNLLMLVPFGFLTAGLLWPKRATLKPLAVCAAILVSVATIVIIKYLQLFFPPRTVTLNYIAAQTFGAAIGCLCFVFYHRRIGPSLTACNPVAHLVLALRIYFVTLVIFLLMPLDFALDPGDLRTQFNRLPAEMVGLPGSNRPLEVRAILVFMAAAAFIPVGMMLRVRSTGARRSLFNITGLGLMITTTIFGLTTLVIGAYPVFGSILYRTCGILIGAVAVSWLERQQLGSLRRRLHCWAPWMAIPYVLVMLLGNRLLSTNWLSAREAIAQAHLLGFLPLFDYYIVSKAEAAKNIVGHALMYAPVGVLLWLRDDTRAGSRAFRSAVVLAFLVETARYCRPGLEGDINTVAVAGFSAMLTARLLPACWSMLEALVDPLQYSVHLPVHEVNRRANSDLD